MADDKGFANITKDAVRLFGIHIQVLMLHALPHNCEHFDEILPFIRRFVPACGRCNFFFLFYSFLFSIFFLLSVCLSVQNKSCRVLMAQSYKAFWVQVGQVVDVSEAVKILK